MDDKSIKKQNAIIFSLSCVFSFMMGCYFFNSLLWFKDTSIKIPTPIVSIKTGTINTSNWSKKISKPIVVNTSTIPNKNTTSWEVKETNKGWTKSILGVQAWYDWETTYERVRNQIIKLWVSYEIAEHITWEAYTNTDDPKLFVKNIIWVSMAEWSVFKKWLYNNYLGVMSRKSDWSYWLRHYDTVQLAISDRREMYNRNKRYIRTTPEAWLRWHYCTSACTYWVSNFNDAVSKLAI